RRASASCSSWREWCWSVEALRHMWLGYKEMHRNRLRRQADSPEVQEHRQDAEVPPELKLWLEWLIMYVSGVCFATAGAWGVILGLQNGWANYQDSYLIPPGTFGHTPLY